MFCGPLSRCCERMDFTWAVGHRRMVAVCVACEKVFYDEPFTQSFVSRVDGAFSRVADAFFRWVRL